MKQNEIAQARRISFLKKRNIPFKSFLSFMDILCKFMFSSFITYSSLEDHLQLISRNWHPLMLMELCSYFIFIEIRKSPRDTPYHYFFCSIFHIFLIYITCLISFAYTHTHIQISHLKQRRKKLFYCFCEAPHCWIYCFIAERQLYFLFCAPIIQYKSFMAKGRQTKQTN